MHELASQIPPPSHWATCKMGALRDAHGFVTRLFEMRAFVEGPAYHREEWQRVADKLSVGGGAFDIDALDSVARMHFQSVATTAVHQQMWLDAVNDESASCWTRARLRSAAVPGAGAWITTQVIRPNTRHQKGNELNDYEFAYAALKRLGAPQPVTVATRCVCGRYDARQLPTVPGPIGRGVQRPWIVSLEEHLCAWHWDGCHANAAGARGPRTARHNGVNELIASGMRTVGWSAQAKEIQLADRPKVRGDLVARNWQSGEGLGRHRFPFVASECRATHKRLAFAETMRSLTSDDDDDDSYGRTAQVETEETKLGNELSHKYQGPEWDGKKGSYTEWRWEATPYLDALGLESVRRGRNRSVLTTSASSKEAITMVIALNKLFRVILRMIKRVGTEAATLQ